MVAFWEFYWINFLSFLLILISTKRLKGIQTFLFARNAIINLISIKYTPQLTKSKNYAIPVINSNNEVQLLIKGYYSTSITSGLQFEADQREQILD